MIKCYENELLSHEFEYDSIGIAYRDQNGLFIVFDHLGEIIVLLHGKSLITKENELCLFSKSALF